MCPVWQNQVTNGKNDGLSPDWTRPQKGYHEVGVNKKVEDDKWEGQKTNKHTHKIHPPPQQHRGVDKIVKRNLIGNPLAT